MPGGSRNDDEKKEDAVVLENGNGGGGKQSRGKGARFAKVKARGEFTAERNISTSR